MSAESKTTLVDIARELRRMHDILCEQREQMAEATATARRVENLLAREAGR